MVSGFALIAVAAAVLVFAGVLHPLWKPARTKVIGGVLALLVASFALYALVGTPAALRPAPPQAQAAPDELSASIAGLRAALQAEPDVAEGWYLLGRALSAQQDFPAARDAFARAVALQPDNPDLLVEAAQARLFAAPGQAPDTTTFQWLQHALEIQPQHPRARWLLGVARQRNGEDAEAARLWESLLDEVDAATAASLRQQIQSLHTGVAATPAATSSTAVTANITLGADIAARLRAHPDAQVFVIARIPDGPAMPVAVKRVPASTLPARLELGDEDSPMPMQKLSTLAEVELVVRLSLDGRADKDEADLESAPVRTSLPTRQPVQLVIGR